MADVQTLPLPKLQACHSGGLCFFTDDDLFAACGVRVAFTTRAGGFSDEPYAGLNLGLHVNDSPVAVRSNTDALLAAMRAPKGVRAFRLNQVHGTDILYVRSDVDIKDTDRIVSARRFDSTACCEFPSDCFGMGDTFAVTNAERDADSVTKAEFLASKSVSKDGQAVVSHACESLQNNSFNDCAADSTLSHTLACGFAGETTVSEVLTRDVAGDYDAVVVDANAYDSAPILCFADCMPLIMVAPTRDFAIAHAGWRGAFGRIAQKAACALACVAQCDTSAINIYIGPYIRTECFEVSPDLRQKFIDEFGEGVASVDSSQPHVDLGMAVRLQLADAGIDPTRICDIDLCTVCNSDTFFSYRASGGVCGRHGAVAFRRYSE